MKNKHRALYISHGGGPMPILGDEGHKEMLECLKIISAKITKPSAIIVVSAHWEEKIPTITAAENPSLIYDYYGFPEESYSIEYGSPGDPVLANKIHRQLHKAGITNQLDEQRGYDHGMFIPLKIMYPEADIPCIQISLNNNLDPAEHIRLGHALQNLDQENLLLIGSGFSFHNMQAFYAVETDEIKAMNESFESWLLDTCNNTEINENERSQRLIHWSQAPAARFCHPREEHLLPLHVCYGFAQTKCSESYELKILNKKSSMYLW